MPATMARARGTITVLRQVRGERRVQRPSRAQLLALTTYDAFTDPVFRRSGVASAIRAQAFAFLREEGYRRSVTAVLPEDRAAVSTARNAGYRPTARSGYVRIGPWLRTFHREL